MSITKRSTSTGPNSYNTSTTTSLPSGTTTGDFTIMNVVQNSYATLTPPSGWTTILSAPGCLVCYRMWQSGDPTSVTTTSTASAWYGSVMITYTGVDASNPIDMANACMADTNYNAPSVNPQYQGGMSILAYSQPSTSGGNGAPTAPTGYTQESYVGYGPNCGLWDKSITGAPATGNQFVSWSASNQKFGAQIVLKASGASAASPRANPQNTFAAMAGQCTQIFSGSPTITVNLANYGVKDGDLLLFGFWTGLTVTTLATFSVLQNNSGYGAVYYRTWHTGDATSLTWTFSGGGWVGWGMAVIRNPGKASSNGIDPVIDTSAITTTSGTSVIAASLVPANSDEMLLVMCGTNATSGVTPAAPSGFTTDLSVTYGPSVWVGDEYPAANPTGSKTITVGITVTLVAIPILISPSTIGGGGPTWDHNPVMVNSN